MAPALTEPISPTGAINDHSGTTTTTPATRSSRKLESVGIKSNSTILKHSQQLREKRNCNSSVTVAQTPTSSIRLTRSRDTEQNNPGGPLDSPNSLPCSKEQLTPRKSFKVSGGACQNNEQMGISTAPLENKSQLSDKNIASVPAEFEKVDKSTKEDTSTAQLLADLTNEAITAEICLRNQLKDVNLVKVSEDPSSPLQRDSDIVVIKAIAATPSTALENKDYTAHMEAQCNETESKSTPVQDSHQEIEKLESKTPETQKVGVILDNQQSEPQDQPSKESDVKEGQKPVELKAVCPEAADRILEAISTQESPIGSPEFNAETKKDTRDTSKAEILSVQELPPVNTDSTMTASEVEDNLEERLSQLDGTAIDSPPPSHDVDMDVTTKNTHIVDDSTTTPPRTPTHQHSLSQDMQQIQQQLQNTPPTPVSQQVQVHHMQQQQNCFTPQSTTSSVNTVGSANIPPSFIKESEGGELEDQDIEEVFKVLKGFEGGTTSDLNVCDLNVLFNEVYMKMNETEINGNSGGSVVQNPSTVAGNPSIQLVKPTELEEGQQDIEKRQQQMQRKVDFLMRRLRKQQSRYMCKHASEEIAGLFEWSSRQASKGVTNNVVNSSSNLETGNSDQDPSKYFLKVIAARPPPSDWRGEQETTVPATQITTLLRKIEAVANAQQLCITPVASLVSLTSSKKTKKALLEAQAAASVAMGTSVTTLAEGRAEDVVVSTLDENVTEELTQVSGLLQSEMCEVQRAIDSDATESSSGGESADEMVNYNNQQQQTLPITKRAAWRYSRDRAAIASRWSWLLSQISDLEIKIRQHSELHQEIVRSKGQVTCPPENGLKVDTKIGETDKEDHLGCCRTRGFIPTQFRKRKLIQTTNIHTISKKAARPSTIKCGCQWPLHPCALCTGRSDPTAPRDLPDTMMMSDRIALLDSGYHPVLSFRENVNNALHFEAIAKQPEWQQRVMRCQAKSIAKNVWKAEREAAAAAGGHNSSKKFNSDTAPTKRRYVKKKDREDKSAVSSGTNSASQTRSTIPSSTDAADTSSQIPSVSSLFDAGNGTATLSTTSTTPLVANKAMTKIAKKQQCLVLGDGILKDSVLPSPLVSSTNTSIPVATTMTLVHQTSDYHLINYDQYNLNQTLSSSISNSSSSKSNKHRKLSSASTAATSHHYNHHHNNNHLYNGESNYLHSNDWSAGVGGFDGIAARSRTSSPTHVTSYHNKNERSFDRKNRVSYDIDNIVIPYSVAAATRVEILPYKEIPTPKWRVINIDGEETNKVETSEIDKNVLSNGHIVCDNKPTILESITIGEDLAKEEESNVEMDSKADNIDNISTSKENIRSCSVSECNNDVNGKNVLKDEVNNTANCHDDKDMNEPDQKKIKVEPNVIDSQTIQTVANRNEFSDSLNEDISDDAMILRHERALTEERRKFQTFLKFPWSTRSRANRRIDSRAESSGANTPDPSSPAPHTPSVGGGDQESIPSPSTPSTPLNTLDTISEAGDNSTSFLGVGFLPSQSSKRQERRRTTSTKRDRELERRSSTPDSKELIPPYEPMKFPLSDEQFEELMRAMPSEHNEESKRFDECYLPGGGMKTQNRSVYGGGSTSKRSSRSSTLCLERRVKGSLKNISADDANIMMPLENGTDILYDDEYEDYPKHHLAPNDDHLTADNCVDPGGSIDEHNDVYGDPYDAYSSRQPKVRDHDSDGDSTETEPFQDDDPNDPEWRGEGEDRSRKKV